MHRSRAPPLPAIPDANVFALFFGAPLPEYTLYVDAASGRRHGVREYLEWVRDAATALGAPCAQGGLGLGADDIVGVFSHNCVSYAALVHACLAIATPFANLSAYATPYELAHGLRTARPTVLFAQPALLPVALAAAKEVGLPESRIYVLEGESPSRTCLQELVDRVRRERVPREAVRPVKRDALAYLVFSSGTSGLPKAVMISHGNIWAMVTAQTIWRTEEAKYLKLTPPKVPPVALSYLPMYHALALNAVAFREFATPVTMVIMEKWDAGGVLKAIEKYRINIFMVVPSVVHQLLNHPSFPTTDFSSVVSAGCGAAHLPPALRDRFLARFKDMSLWEGFGMSELTLGISRTPPPGMYGLRVPPASCGLLVSGVAARIVRDDGTDAAPGEPGELWVRAPMVALGYYGDARATHEAFAGGWLRTGDWMRIDADGFLYFVERRKDTLKVGGAQVAPRELEDVLHAHPGALVRDVCVAGVRGGRTADERVPRAWVVLSDAGRRVGARAALEALEAWTRANLSPYKHLRGGFEVVDEIPKNPTGKVMRRVLQERFEAQYAGKAKL
ncbi:acetyl-CoA synthetase-like protein [Phanerochaete sordida]|uniref:Acetyl-CoA synthetase-like protein n=1 Tax=Phanerochaete sordida TaxID=48140 RepID=A0A9P3LFZ6_9APHY|nr:acetyl-CoA synthetase-like protein [Phanerochaete sordida]